MMTITVVTTEMKRNTQGIHNADFPTLLHQPFPIIHEHVQKVLYFHLKINDGLQMALTFK